MKKTVLFLFALTFIFTMHEVKAQIINPGFESWTADFLVPTAMNPNTGNASTGWWDYNYFNYAPLGSSPISLTRCTDTVHSGTYSVRLETKVYTTTSWTYYKAWGVPFIGHEYNDTLGIMFNGKVDATVPSYRPGIPCTQKLIDYRFYYQYKPKGNDTAECRVMLLSAGTPVAGGSFKSNVATGASGWQQAVINFTYISSLIPDTLWVLYSSSSLDDRPKAGSVMWIDDVSVTLPTGVNQSIGEENPMELYPNPSKGVFTLQTLKLNLKSPIIEVYNMLGEKIYLSNLENMTDKQIDISFAPKGIYFVKLMEGDKSYTKKVIIE